MFSFRQLRALLGAALVMLVLGSLYVFGAIAPYVASFLYHEGDSSVTVSSVSLILTLSIITINAGLAVPLVIKSDRVTSLVSIMGLAGSMLLLSICKNYWAYVGVYGVGYGIFNGLGYLAPMKNCFSHLPNRKGLCSGVCIMGYGMGALIFNQILQAIINPGNLKIVPETGMFPEQVSDNVPTALRVISGVYLIMGMCGVLLMPPKPKQRQQAVSDIESSLIEDATSTQNSISPDIEAKESQITDRPLANDPFVSSSKTAQSGITKTNSIESSESICQTIYKKRLHLLILAIALSAPFGMFLAFCYKEIGQQHISDDHFLTLVGSFGGFFNGFCRLIWGALCDKYSLKKMMSFIYLVNVVLAGSIYWTSQNQYSFLIAVVASYSFYGGNFSFLPIIATRSLGVQKGTYYYWVMFASFTLGKRQWEESNYQDRPTYYILSLFILFLTYLGAIIQTVLHTVLVGKFGSSGFTYCFIILFCCSICSFLLVWKANCGIIDYPPQLSTDKFHSVIKRQILSAKKQALVLEEEL